MRAEARSEPLPKTVRLRQSAHAAKKEDAKDIMFCPRVNASSFARRECKENKTTLDLENGGVIMFIAG